MMEYSLTIHEAHLAKLREITISEGGDEGAACILCGCATVALDPWDDQSHRRLLVYDVIGIPGEDIVSVSDTHITCRTKTFAGLLKRAKNEGLTVGYVHSHPDEVREFSIQDDTDEPALVELAQNRNGSEAEVVSLVLTPSGHIFGRVWKSRTDSTPLEMVRIVGERLILSYDRGADDGTPESLHRQSLAFGPALNHDLARLSVGIVGCGATGSATGMLLARLGVCRIVGIDNDVVEETNLNRLHGACYDDVTRKTPKVAVMQRHLKQMGLGTRVVPYQGWVGDPACRDLLRSCDIIFGCTDDHDGRLLLNRFAYFYLVPVFDMGIDINLADTLPPHIISADGRVTALLPGSRCLLCRHVIDPRTASEEYLKRSNPNEYERQVEEKYVRGGGRPDPAVVTFTTDTACMAVDELLHRLTGYRHAGSAPNRLRRFHRLEDNRPGPHPVERCPICLEQGYWGRGDTEPFLDRIG